MRKKLKEVCDFYSGTGFPVKYQGEDYGELPFYKVGDIANNVTAGNVYLSLCNNFISHEVAKEIKGTIIPANVVVFAKIGEALKLNRRAITVGDCLIDNNAMGIGGKSEYLNSMYFYFYMKNLKMEKLAESTTVPSVRKTKLEEVEIDVPTLVEQSEIVDILAKLQKVINERQEQLEKLDDLIKARFVELFGDPETNPMGWDHMTLNDVCSSVVRGPFGSALKKEFFVEPSDTTYKVYEQKHAIQKSATIGAYYVTAEKYNELKRFECLPGDILMSCSGTMGELYQLPQNCERGIINQALCKFTLNNRILPVCFLEYMKHTIGNLETKGSGIQNIAAVSYVKAMPINVPPMDIQETFAAFVEQVDKSKSIVQKSLDEAQLLFDSLMQKYFG